jgi:anti-sigma B factor antagonist
MADVPGPPPDLVVEAPAADLDRFSFELVATVDGVLLLAAAGELDLAVAAALRAVLLDHRDHSMLIDLTPVTFIDSTVIGVLVAAFKRAEAAKVTFGVCNPTPVVRHTLGIVGVDALLIVDENG